MSADLTRFSDDEERTLASVLDAIIPPDADRGFPGAGELGLARHVEQVLERTPQLRPLIARGLAALDELARGRGSQDFAALPGGDRRELLPRIGADLAGFLPSLTFHTYVGYYQNPRVLEALGLEARPPYPKGYEMEPNDLTLLDPVRERPKFYRE